MSEEQLEKDWEDYPEEERQGLNGCFYTHIKNHTDTDIRKKVRDTLFQPGVEFILEATHHEWNARKQWYTTVHLYPQGLTIGDIYSTCTPTDPEDKKFLDSCREVGDFFHADSRYYDEHFKTRVLRPRQLYEYQDRKKDIVVEPYSGYFEEMKDEAFERLRKSEVPFKYTEEETQSTVDKPAMIKEEFPHIDHLVDLSKKYPVSCLLGDAAVLSHNIQEFLEGLDDLPAARKQLLINHLSLCLQAAELMAKKNQDYGGDDIFGNLDNSAALVGIPTECGILVRMGDKLSRLGNIIQSGKAAVKDESVKDSVDDIINYAILLYEKHASRKEM